MRITTGLLLLTFTAVPTSAAQITGSYAMPCDNVSTLRRMEAVAASGDQAGLIALINSLLSSGECRKLAKGAGVRVESTEGRYACVAALGTADVCRWVFTREVGP